MNIFLGDRIRMIRGETDIEGRVDGIKLKHGEIERVSIEHLDNWLFMADGWRFVQEIDEISEEDDA